MEIVMRLNNMINKFSFLMAARIFHTLFWATAMLWLYIAGQYGSGAPRPRGWRWMDEIEILLVVFLFFSFISGYFQFRRNSLFPITSALSFMFLIIAIFFYIR